MKRKFEFKSIIFICIMLLYITCLQAQDKTVSGTVSNGDNGLPLEGVTVAVVETAKHAVTDAKGKYNLSIPNGKTKIVFSFTGYTTQTIDVGDKTVINVTLTSNANQLTDVTVTALGITKQKRTIGYATQELAKKDLTDARDVNVANYLTGKVAGVQVSLSAGGVGGSSKVIIRGISSLTGENQPLYVVDGIPLDNTKYQEGEVYTDGRDFGDGIGNINPQDIESLSVLKGPNATALYGSRGSNGVIVITTKSGKAGKGIAVEINSNVTIDKLNLFPKLQNKYMTGYEDMNLYGDVDTIDGVAYQTIPSWHYESMGPAMKG
ncbi:MAG TPA: TonB-dependent receptor plug domain-containing protein, partial [Chitinophagaceae bacterium]